MIFVDESGKRWKRIKRSSAAMVAIGTVPVLGLIGASFMYRPEWGALPLVQQATNLVLGTPASTQTAQVNTPSAPNPTVVPRTARRTVSSSQQVLGTSAPASTPLVAITPTPRPTTTPSPTPTPALKGDPVQNDHGQAQSQSRKPVK